MVDVCACSCIAVSHAGTWFWQNTRKFLSICHEGEPAGIPEIRFFHGPFSGAMFSILSFHGVFSVLQSGRHVRLSGVVCLVSVSYTHLDVYKRQDQSGTLCHA